MSFFDKLFSVFKKGGEIAGLDIGNHSIKLTQVEKKGTNYILTHYSTIPTQSGLINEGIISDPNLLAESLKRLITSSGMKIKRVVSSVGGPSVVIRPIPMQQMPEKDLKSAIQFEAERYLPYPTAEAQIDCHILKKSLEHDSRSMEVMLVAAPKEMVTKLQEATTLAGLQLDSVEPEPEALLRAFGTSTDPELSNKVIAMVNLGASISSINIVRGGELRQSRMVNIAGNNFTKSISQSLNISFDEAEKLKKEKGVIRISSDTSPIAPTTTRIFNVIAPILDDLKLEIQRSFDYYRSRYRGENIELVILSGGTSRFTNIDSYLTNELGIPVKTADMKGKINISNTISMTEEQLKELLPTLVVSIGLAMRKL